ncbi:MAG: hypothetical protein K2X99_02780 [Gemmatimonadaceae bacterium]|nr:hypothetical protein [Gemmatimonadaceae bacterium]
MTTLSCADGGVSPPLTAESLNVRVPMKVASSFAAAVKTDTGRLELASRSAATEWAAVPPEVLANSAPLYSWATSAGFEDRIAYAQAFTSHGANNVAHRVTMSLAYNQQDMGAAGEAAQGADSDFLPVLPGGAPRAFYTNKNHVVGASCGWAFNAQSTHKVWNSLMTSNQSILTWGTREETSSNHATQPACRGETQSTGSGSGSSGWQVCYYTVWYDTAGNDLGTDFLYCTAL